MRSHWTFRPASARHAGMTIVLMLGSAPNATQAQGWDRDLFDHILAINNAWRIREDWTHWIHPWDFPDAGRPAPKSGQKVITQDDFVPAQNQFGGFVYAGGTMAFTAAYWALAALKPSIIAVLGCDMTYAKIGATHFYGTGTADPLRKDITLRNLEAKATRLEALAATQGTAIVNLSDQPSRLTFRRASLQDLAQITPRLPDPEVVKAAQARETDLNYHVPSGRYWEEADRFDIDEIDDLDALWLNAYSAKT
ncbi:MAG: hypothetical protein ABI459_05160 [Deltaproteobacteria bacterium]